MQKIPAEKLYNVIHKSVPQACLFTIVPIPENDERKPGCSQSLPPDPSVNNLLPTIFPPSTDALSSFHPSIIPHCQLILYIS